MPRDRIAIVAVLLAAALIVVAVRASRTPDMATPSPSPASPTPTATATATSAPTATPTASPSPTPQGLYTSKKLGYALELPPPWRPAICGSSDPVDTRLPAIEQFTNAVPIDEELGHIGSPNDRVEVSAEDNPQRLSPVDFAASGRLQGPVPAGSSPAPRSVTFAGRPAAEVTFPDGPQAYFVADGDRMFTVLYRPGSSSVTPDTATMLRIVRSFRFLSPSERQALPDPTPIPAAAPTAQALAGMLATAFQQRDVAALERLLSPCVTLAAQNGGGSAQTRDRYVSGLRTQFANGLTVAVDTNTIRTDALGSGDTFVRARWTDPGQQPRNVDLMLGRTRDGLLWRGVLFLPPG